MTVTVDAAKTVVRPQPGQVPTEQEAALLTGVVDGITRGEGSAVVEMRVGFDILVDTI